MHEGLERIRIMEGKTYTELLRLFQTSPLTTKDEIGVGISVALLATCDALDNDRIHFDTIKDKALLMLFLAATMMNTSNSKVPVKTGTNCTGFPQVWRKYLSKWRNNKFFYLLPNRQKIKRRKSKY